ncbi:hypothetical protein [Flavobacterium urocaniciphilum]|uniref:hypothetical protein n=1 Tax=Flavobacterium urocaniciphilum TaxID=1299341 RepID=UPI0015A61EDF|nr:hypothetical protein [Flavobacterium urocaniciphilum]
MKIYSQVGIGTNMPKDSAMLEIIASNKGVKIPHVQLINTSDQTTITSGNIESLLVYVPTPSGDIVQPGYYYWRDFPINKWERLLDSSVSLNQNFWSLTGNSNTNYLMNYLGTNDDQDLVFKRNQITAGFLRNDNTAFGVNSLNYQTTFLPGANNAAFGSQALEKLTSSGFYNTAIGARSLKNCTIGTYNAAIGMDALGNITSGNANLGMGYAAMRGGSTCSYNVALGGQCMNDNNDDYNVGIGFQTAYKKITGQANVFIGTRAAFTSINSSNNVIIGSYSFYLVPNGLQNNIVLGNNVGSASNVVNATGNVIIGNNITLPPSTVDNIILADGNGNERIRAVASGNIGIGTSTPSAKLEVAGKIKATDVNFTGLPTFLDESAAIIGGLVTGDMYKTPTGELRIKL